MDQKPDETGLTREGEASPQGMGKKLARIRRIREMIRRGEYDAKGKMDAILDGIVKDLL